MKVKIDKHLSLESDEHNFILREQRISKNGKIRTIFKYFGNLESGADYMFNREIKQSTAEDFQQLLNEISFIKSEVRRKLRKVI